MAAMTSWPKPQAWNIGAATTTRLARPPGDPIEHRGHRVGAALGTAGRALGGPRGARGEQDDLGRAAPACAGLAPLLARISLLQRPDAAAVRLVLPGDELDQVIDLGAGVLDETGELLVVDHQLGLLAGHDIGELRPGEAGVEQKRVAPSLVAAPSASTKPAVVAAQDGDGADRPSRRGPHRGDARGERVGTPAELAPGRASRARRSARPRPGAHGRRQDQADGRGDAVAAYDQAHPGVLVGAQRRDQAGAGERWRSATARAPALALRSPLLMSADPLSR